MARRTTAERTADRIVSRRILVGVKRDVNTVTPLIIWEHELPLLTIVHGEDKLQVLDPSSMDDGYSEKISPTLLVHNKVQDRILRPSTVAGIGFVFFGAPQAEYDRLVAVYGRDVDQPIPVVERVYGRYQDGKFDRAVGQAELTDMPVAQLLENIKAFGYLPQLHPKSTPEEIAAEKKAREELHGTDKEGLLKLADQLGIAVDA